jgi:hypothetical protein
MGTGIEQVHEVVRVGGRGLAVLEVCQVGAHALQSKLGKGLVDVVAGDALAVAPSASLVGAEAGPANLLGMARYATQVPVDKLPLGCDARHPFRMRGAIIVVIIRRQRPELGVGSNDNPEPRDKERREKPDEEVEIVLHGAGLSIAEGALNQAGTEMFSIRHDVR